MWSSPPRRPADAPDYHPWDGEDHQSAGHLSVHDQHLRSRHRSGVLFVLGGVLSVQVGAAFAKGLFDTAGPAGVVWLRLAIAAVVLLVVVRPSVPSLAGHQWRPILVFGLVLAGMNWSFYEALDRIPLGVAVTIEFVGPLGVAVLAGRSWRQWLLATLAAGGILLLTQTGSGSLDRAGLALALTAGLLWATYIVMSARVGAAVPGAGGLAVALVVGALATLPGAVRPLATAQLSPSFLGSAALVALMSSVVPYALELEALRRIPAALFGVLLSLEPAAAALAGAAVLGERLLARQWAGIVLVVLAASAATLLRSSSATTPAPDPSPARD
jgi:inner membrane transporter RhtA